MDGSLVYGWSLRRDALAQLDLQLLNSQGECVLDVWGCQREFRPRHEVLDGHEVHLGLVEVDVEHDALAVDLEWHLAHGLAVVEHDQVQKDRLDVVLPDGSVADRVVPALAVVHDDELQRAEHLAVEEGDRLLAAPVAAVRIPGFDPEIDREGVRKP